VSVVAPAEPERPVAELEERVTPLELFFDLVFVFGFTQVTTLMSNDPTWRGLGQGMLILAAIWWAWAAYSWLTNEIDTDRETSRLVVFSVMGAMLIAALAVPQAFGDDGVLFGVAYMVVRLMHLVAFAESSRDVSAAQAMRRLWATAVPAPVLLVVAGFLDGTAQAALWVIALTIDLAGPYVRGVEGFRVSAGYFAERFGLIVIIALGESIVSIGLGASATDLGGGEVVAAILGIAVAAALWWGYFDVVAVVAERRFRQARGLAQVQLARDSYSYLHLPMIAGIVLLALGVKKTLAHVDEPLKIVPAVALCGGVALYYAGHIGFRLRNVGSLNRQRLVAALILLAMIPLATELDAVYALALVTATCAALVTYEVFHFREARARMRAAEG
jgi:low temperature requirement protein LtrA